MGFSDSASGPSVGRCLPPGRPAQMLTVLCPRRRRLLAVAAQCLSRRLAPLWRCRDGPANVIAHVLLKLELHIEY